MENFETGASDLYAKIMLSFQRALLSYIPCHIKSVVIGWNDARDIMVRYISENQPSKKDLEIINEMITEVYADFPFKITIEIECIKSKGLPADFIMDRYQYIGVAYQKLED